MKKRLFFAMMAFAALVGCSSGEETKPNETPEEPGGGNDTPTIEAPAFTASIEAINGSRVVIDNSTLKLAWSEEDYISVFNASTYQNKYAYTGQDNTFEIEGEPKAGKDVEKIYAIYPYDPSSAITSGGRITHNLPFEQKFSNASGSFDTANNTMLAVTEKGSTNLSFQNLCGYLCVQLWGDVSVKEIKFNGNNDEIIAGKAEIAESNGVFTITMANTNRKIITLNCGNGVELGKSEAEATTFWLVVPAIEYSKGFTLTITDTEGYSAAITYPKEEGSFTVERNTIHTLAPTQIIPEVGGELLFDAQFNLDGSVTDKGIYGLTVERMVDSNGETPYMYTYTHPDYPHNNIVKFTRASSNRSNYQDNFYRADISSNTALQNKIKDGFTLEFISYTPSPVWDIWSRPGGSNAFSILRKGEKNNNYMRMLMNSNSGNSNYGWLGEDKNAQSAGEFHHSLYVYNKNEGLAYLYLDGELAHSAKASLTETLNYIGICGQTMANGDMNQPWDGDVAMMRIYDQPMTAAVAAKRYASLTIPGKSIPQPVPTPMFDAKFNADGTAENIGSLNSLTIQTKANADLLEVNANADYSHNNIATFKHTFKSSPTDGYFLVDYSQSQEFKDKMTDGYYTLEVVASYDLALDTPKCAVNSRAKLFGGDYEIEYVKTAKFDIIEGDENNFWPGFGIWYNNPSETFISAAADSGDAKPQAGNSSSYAFVHKEYINRGNIESQKFYHVVAVYDVHNGTNSIYINGCKNNEKIAVSAGLKLPDAAANQQFFIGGDVEYYSGVATLQNTWNGRVAMARIYDEALSTDQIASLYSNIEEDLNALNQ